MRQESSLPVRLEKVDAELGNLARFAAKTGRADEAADLGAVQLTRIDAEAFGAMAEERVLELRRALDLSPDRGWSLFLSLLGDRRMLSWATGGCAWARIRSMGSESRASST